MRKIHSKYQRRLDFTKLEATGNDFVLVDARRRQRDWSALAREICRRHFGIGADGLLLLLPSISADLKLRVFNPDGSEAEACGNGLRCLARHARDSGIVPKDEFTIETIAGIRAVRAGSDLVQVGMGFPEFKPDAIPVRVENPNCSSRIIDYPLKTGKNEFKVSCVSMGNPHAVCFLESPVTEFPLTQTGPRIERHTMFPERVNFEIVNVTGPRQLKARVWERGAGETLACGTGACAIAVVAKLKGLTEAQADVELPGGILTVSWDGEGQVFLSGPAREVFRGTWPESEIRHR